MKSYFENNKLTFLIVFSAMIMGIIIGSSSVARLNQNDATELYSAVKDSIESTGIFTAFSKSISNEFKKFFMLFICGLTVFGSPVSVFVIGLTGYSLGFSVGFLLKYFGLVGLLASFFGIIPHYILLFPAFCCAGVIGINFSNGLLMVHKRNAENLKAYVAKMIIILLIILIACVIEGFFSSFLLKKIIGVIQ